MYLHKLGRRAASTKQGKHNHKPNVVPKATTTVPHDLLHAPLSIACLQTRPPSGLPTYKVVTKGNCPAVIVTCMRLSFSLLLLLLTLLLLLLALGW